MPRQNRRRTDAPLAARPSPSAGERRESWRGVDYVVRAVAGAAAVKAYRCPGCDQEVRIGVAHVVAWPAFDADADGRRHWHSACWAARERRAPGVQRSRSAPRY
ncbi:MAG: hypothetical protein ACR2LF_13750 [Jatrophihabitantaceae bacterium]